MAKITILGDTLQIKSELTREDIDRVADLVPEALKLYDKNENEIFGIELGDASLSQYGICFCSADANGKVFMTTNNPCLEHGDPEEERKAVIKHFAPLLSKLEAVEAKVAEAKEAVGKMEASADASVVYAE